MLSRQHGAQAGSGHLPAPRGGAIPPASRAPRSPRQSPASAAQGGSHGLHPPASTAPRVNTGAAAGGAVYSGSCSAPQRDSRVAMGPGSGRPRATQPPRPGSTRGAARGGRVVIQLHPAPRAAIRGEAAVPETPQRPDSAMEPARSGTAGLRCGRNRHLPARPLPATPCAACRKRKG